MRPPGDAVLAAKGSGLDHVRHEQIQVDQQRAGYRARPWRAERKEHERICQKVAKPEIARRL